MPTELSALNAPPLSPPLKWAGGKRWLLPNLRTWWVQLPPDTRLVEPFCGGLAVALGLQPRQALLNDINPHLINFYRHLQTGFSVDPGWQNDRSYYDAHRTRFNELILTDESMTLEGARRFYYLNKTGYNGLCRFNKRGLFNVPFGRYASIGYGRDWAGYQAALAPWHFTCGGFRQVEVGTGDAVYADPPYDVPFVQYSQGGFDWAQQVELAHWLATLPNPVLTSNQATDRILELYRDLDFSVLTLPAPRRIACTGDRTAALELLAWRNGPPLAELAPFLQP